MIESLIGSFLLGWETLLGYLAELVLACLVPVFFIAGAIPSFCKMEALFR